MDYTKVIFVFGSNEGGFHGAGAAAFAMRRKGAILYQPFGMQGQSFAIPTKDETIKNTLPLTRIQKYVNSFLDYAALVYASKEFQITRIGCGLAGLKDEDIAPMFKNHSPNCWFDEAWKPWLPENTKYWGTFP